MPTLVRRLGLLSSIGLVIGITIGGGIFRTPASIATRVPDPMWMLAVWAFCGVIADTRPDGSQWTAVGRGLDRMAPPDPNAGPRWFLDARLNFAENLLRYRDDRLALIGRHERGRGRTLTYAELAAEVGQLADALRVTGVRAGDRVAVDRARGSAGGARDCDQPSG